MLASTRSAYPGRPRQGRLGTKSPGSPSWVRNRTAIVLVKGRAAIVTRPVCAPFLFPASGGDQKSHVVSGASTGFTIDKLQESSAYKIQVSAVVGKREGNPVLVTARTRESCQTRAYAIFNFGRRIKAMF